MSKNLLIVESPAKAKTIAKYLGNDYAVKSSYGHVRDLPKKGLSIDIKHNFKPTYEISTDKKKVVAELKKAAAGKTVWLATDDDREGEAIAWHLCDALKLNSQTAKRITFHEITKPAIEKALLGPRTIDQKLVDAQQARRILDRLVGYELSPVLWKKVRTGLSAGRVQSVAVRLIVEREREIIKFEPLGSYKIQSEFKAKGHNLKAELPQKLETKPKAKEFLNHCSKATFKVESLDQKPGSRNPAPPFTTSSLQQEAARKLGFSVKQTMTLAQRLYENGQITYMRTDSVVLADYAINVAKAYINKNYGDNYVTTRQYQTKTKGAQEAHEAIRPTDFNKTEAGREAGERKLYNLIWRRALASQMSAAQVERTEMSIGISNRPEKFIASGEVLKFDGWIKVYGGGKDDVILPPLVVGQVLELNSMLATQTFSKPAARYSEASLVRRLEELGIGRPSTYAPTISVIQARGYVEKKDIEGQERQITTLKLAGGKVTESTETVVVGADRAKLFPTFLAEMTTDFLTKHFSKIVDYDFTAKAEADFDDIAEGKQSWQAMIKEFYAHFTPLLKSAESVTRKETSHARKLGNDPTSGEPIIARFGRFGPMLQKGDTENKDVKPHFAALPEGATLESITLKDALPMFKLPRKLGVTKEGEEITANIGPYGPYVQIGKTFVSIKPLSPFTVSEKEALKLYEAKKAKAAKRVIKDFGNGLMILRGPYGPYITDGKKNAKIDKITDGEKMDETTARKILAEAKPGFRRFRKKTKKT